MEICCFIRSSPLGSAGFLNRSRAACFLGVSVPLEGEVLGDPGADPAAALIIEDPIETRSSC